MRGDGRATRETDTDGPAVRVSGLRKAFGEQVVLDGIDLEVARGEALTVLGRSGTGKSVLLKLIVGLQQPDAGSIQIGGQEIGGLPLDRLNEIRKKVGFLFQQAALYDSLTVEENVAFPLRRHTDLAEGEHKARVRDLLSRMGMEEDLDKMPAEISGGMKKRSSGGRAKCPRSWSRTTCAASKRWPTGWRCCTRATSWSRAPSKKSGRATTRS